MSTDTHHAEPDGPDPEHRGAELERRLGAVRRDPLPPAACEGPGMRIGIEDARGRLLHTVETTRLVEAVRVFEVLGEMGLRPQPGGARREGHFTRVYREPR